MAVVKGIHRGQSQRTLSTSNDDSTGARQRDPTVTQGEQAERHQSQASPRNLAIDGWPHPPRVSNAEASGPWVLAFGLG